jgi:hypothetical protein
VVRSTAKVWHRIKTNAEEMTAQLREIAENDNLQLL